MATAVATIERMPPNLHQFSICVCLRAFRTLQTILDILFACQTCQDGGRGLGGADGKSDAAKNLEMRPGGRISAIFWGTFRGRGKCPKKLQKSPPLLSFPCFSRWRGRASWAVVAAVSRIHFFCTYDSAPSLASPDSRWSCS